MTACCLHLSIAAIHSLVVRLQVLFVFEEIAFRLLWEKTNFLVVDAALLGGMLTQLLGGEDLSYLLLPGVLCLLLPGELGRSCDGLGQSLVLLLASLSFAS